MAEKRRSTQGAIGATRLYFNGSPTQVPGQTGRFPEGLKTMPTPSRTITLNPNRPGNLPLALGTLGIPYNTSGRRMSTNVEDRRSPLMPMASQFGQLPQPFQDRFRQRQQMGLNQGMSEQQAVDFYNTNYISGAPLPQSISSQGGLAPQQGTALQPPGYLSGVREMASGAGQTLMDAGRYAGRAILGGMEGLSSLSGSARGAGGVARERIYPPVTEGYPLDEAVKDIGSLSGSGRGLSGLGGLSGMLRRPAETVPQIQQTPQQGPLTGSVAQPPSPNPPPPATTPRFQGMSLADQFDADVQQQIQQNPSPVNQFMDQEMMGRTREGQAMGLRGLQSAFLSQPMQGGMVRGSTADTMRDREQRLAMLGGMNPPRDVGAELTQTRSEQDMVIDEELARQGMTPEKLAEVARLSGRPELMQGGRSARSLLAPGTVIRGMGGGGVPFTIARGQEETSARREARLASLPARRKRDRAAVSYRLANMRLGRQTMAANQMAAQQRAIDMATNPLVNPMLVASSPSALSAVFQTQQAQRDLVANAPLRQAQIDQANAEIARNKAETERLNDPNQIEMARNQQLLDSLVGSNDPQSIAMRNNLLRRQQEIMNRMSGQQDSLMPPNVTAPIVPDPQTGAISSSQIRQRMNQLSAYGFQGEDLIRQLEEAGVDRRAIGDMLRGIKDSVLNRFLISEQDMNTIRGLKTTLGIPLYE